MRIKTTLRLATALSVFAAICLVVGVLVGWKRIVEVERFETSVHEVYRSISELNILTYEYLMHHEERMQQQWRMKYRSVAPMLSDAVGAESWLTYGDEISEIDEELRKLSVIFETVVDNHKTVYATAGDLPPEERLKRAEVLEGRLVARLLITSESIITDVSRLMTQVHESSLNTVRMSGYFALSLVLLLALGQTALSVGVAKSISRPLLGLEAGVNVVGRGDLTHKVPVVTNDEMGRLASGFNDMVRNLRSVTASRDDLDREVQERTQAEQKFAAAFHHSPLIMGISDVKTGRFLEVNDTLCRVFGYSRDEVIGHTSTELGIWTQEGRGPMASEAAEKGEVTDLETHLVTREGARLECLFHATTITFGQDKALLGIVQDITKRKQTEARIEGLNQLMEALIRPGRPEEKARCATDALVKILDVNFARIWMVRPGDRCDAGCYHAGVKDGANDCPRNRCLHLVASSGRYTRTDGEVHGRVPIGSYNIGRVASGESPGFVTNEVTKDPGVHDREWAATLGLVSFAGNRLLSQSGDVIGVLAVFSKHVIGAEEEALLKTIANTTAQVLHGAITEETLRDSETRFRALTEQSGEGISLADAESNFTFVNPAFCKLTGYSEEELLQMKIVDLDPRQDKTHVFQKVLKNKGTVREAELCRKDGSEFLAEVRGYPVKIHNKLCSLELVRDITAQRRAERESRQYAETQVVLLREVNHRVKNNLAAIVGMIQGEADRTGTKDDKLQLGALGDLETRVRGLAIVHGMLSAAAWRPLVLTELCKEVARSALRGVPRGKTVEIRVVSSPVTVSSDQAHHLALVINELAANTVKHALAGRQSAVINVQIAQTDGKIEIVYTDDGPGFPEHMLSNSSGRGNVGYDLVFGIVGRSLRGDVTLANPQGAAITITFPAGKTEKEA